MTARAVVRVKICGVRTVDDARFCVDAGADAIGLNFVPTSPRLVDVPTARRIVDAVGDRTLVVGVVAGMPVVDLRSLRQETGVGCLQLHGGESADDLRALLPHAYAAVSIAGEDDVARAEAMPGEYVMVDTKVAGELGGTGKTFDWSLVVGLARRRRLVLAGGLVPRCTPGAATRRAGWRARRA